MSKLDKLKKSMVNCSFFNRCNNYNIECHHCKWNASCDVGDYLILKTSDGKTIKYLESN